MSRHPEVKWAQRVDKVYITVLLPDAKNAKVNLNPEGVFTFSASAGPENHLYELKLDLRDKVDVEESKINKGARSIFCVLEKSEKNWWKKLLRRDDKPPHYLKVDWDKWVDEDDDTGPSDFDTAGPSDFDTAGMDFSKFGDMEGMGDDAMSDDFDDSDEDQELAKPEELDHKAGGEEYPEENDIVKEEGGAPEGKTGAARST